jgi:hypothetical protein
VAHAEQAEAEETPAPRVKSTGRLKETNSAAEDHQPEQGTLAERLRRWFGS